MLKHVSSYLLLFKVILLLAIWEVINVSTPPFFTKEMNVNTSMFSLFLTLSLTNSRVFSGLTSAALPCLFNATNCGAVFRPPQIPNFNLFYHLWQHLAITKHKKQRDWEGFFSDMPAWWCMYHQSC